jgi:hypothetical protein
VHKHIDLLSSAEQMAKDLEGIDAEYIFFAAYLQKDTEQENWQVNGISTPHRTPRFAPNANQQQATCSPTSSPPSLTPKPAASSS